MQNPLSYYTMLAKHWLWLILLGVVLCGGGTYIASKLSQPVYQATAFLNVEFQSSTSPYENTTASLEIVPTYAKYITSPTILESSNSVTSRNDADSDDSDDYSESCAKYYAY